MGSASFATSRQDAEAYLNNPGFGGSNLYKTTVQIQPEEFLDLHDMAYEDAIKKIETLTGLKHPGAIGVDEWVPRIAGDLRDAGIEWVRVTDSYPAGAETYTFVGQNDPDMEDA